MDHLIAGTCCRFDPPLDRLRTRDHFPDYLVEGRRSVLFYYPHPHVTLLDPVSPCLAGEGENHLPRFPGLCHDRECDDLVPDRIFTWFNFLYRNKRDLLGGQKIFCPVNKDDPLVRKDTLEGDRFDIYPLGPYEHFFIAAEFWIAHDTT
jgi:hypothetical protein